MRERAFPLQAGTLLETTPELPAPELFAAFVADAGHIRACPRMAAFVALVVKLYRAKARGEDLVFPAAANDKQESAAYGAATLREFLTMDDAKRGCAIRCVKGRVTLVRELRAAFEACMYSAPFVADDAVLKEFGFTIPSKRENVCCSCKQIARSRGGKCCLAYNAVENRTKGPIVTSMMLVPQQ